MAQQMTARVLDIDLDCFVHDPVHFRAFDDPRLDAAEHPPWEVGEVMSFLRDQCGLRDRLPGVAVEDHGDLFAVWRDWIAEGAMPSRFHLSHVDAHADLGLGETDHRYLLTELLGASPEDRGRPQVGQTALTDGSFLAFAVACRWITDIDYVFCPGGGSDTHPYLMDGFDPHGDAIRLTLLDRQQFEAVSSMRFERPDIESPEPLVPLHQIRVADFHADAPFDFVFLTRSPAFTPAEADPIFNEIRRDFIDESLFADVPIARKWSPWSARADWF